MCMSESPLEARHCEGRSEAGVQGGRERGWGQGLLTNGFGRGRGGKGLGAHGRGRGGVKTHLDGALGLNGGAIGGGGGEGVVGLAAQLGGKLVLDLARVAGERDLAHEVPVLVAIVLRRNLSSK